MAKVYLFNPENDLALAFGGANYSPPKLAAALRDAGAWLPMWLAAPGDSLLAPAADSRWLDATQTRFGLDAKRYEGGAVDGAMPWGWSKAAKATLLRAGVSANAMPDDAALERYRELSHRRISIAVNSALQQLGIPVDVPVEAHSLEDVAAAIKRYGRAMIKSPWSSSGRGVLDSNAGTNLSRQAEGIIRHQGSVLVERYRHKVLDFAMLFTITPLGARFRGLSLFGNARATAYAGNIVAPQAVLRQAIAAEVDADLTALAEALEHELGRLLAGRYEGNCGVDMMVVDDGAGREIVPCVEVNLRTTMGFVALSLYERFLADGSRGVYRIVQNDDAPTESVVEANRLVDGCVDLVAPGSRFRFLFEASSSGKPLQLTI